MIKQKKRNIVVANWKMNPTSWDEAKSIFGKISLVAKKLSKVDIVIASPFIFFNNFSKLKFPKNISLGAQNVFYKDSGAFTGEISPLMLKNSGVKYVIVGHSERRAMGETSSMVNEKLKSALSSNLLPILCIGEKVHDTEGDYIDFIKTQLKESLAGIVKKDMLSIIVAYEPVWAIGKSAKDAMKPSDIYGMVILIKKILGEMFDKDTPSSVKIIYGGSVEAENASEVIECGEVEGFLVGHASLRPEEFSSILKSADLKKK